MNTFRNGGVRALYTGVTPVLGAQAVYKACVFSVNNVTMSKITAYKTRDGGTYTPTLFDIWFCGVCGGCVNGTAFVSPVEFVRNQQIALHSRASTAEGTSSEAMRRKMKTPIDIIRQTLRREGILGLWRGTGVTVLRDSLGCGGFFVMNELGKRCLGPHLGGRESKATFLAAGACAGWGVSRVYLFRRCVGGCIPFILYNLPSHYCVLVSRFVCAVLGICASTGHAQGHCTDGRGFFR